MWHLYVGRDPSGPFAYVSTVDRRPPPGQGETHVASYPSLEEAAAAAQALQLSLEGVLQPVEAARADPSRHRR